MHAHTHTHRETERDRDRDSDREREGEREGEREREREREMCKMGNDFPRRPLESGKIVGVSSPIVKSGGLIFSKNLY